LKINDEYNWSLYKKQTMRCPALPYSFRANSKDQLCQALSPVQVYLPVIAPSCKRHISDKQGMARFVRGIP
jgi:hypothetical protein